MVDSVFPPPHIESVAVRQEGLSAQFLDHVRHGLGIVGPQIGKVARLAEMQLDGDQLLFKINLPDSRLFHELFQLLQEVGSRKGM